ncbi:prepilin-type N-terminal cleavage/methylation domain-containing protein [Pelagibacterales bacterium SAG-MED28]|nr:prepilin-type N-terminal cleavage/methylation domain-containing protein [Pelagibacterales bacterium SAG-MED28]|tara:strand:+ start:183 stop:668 length:486 start_codon:yes stop_codon:yes gene_type:complete
MKTKKFRKNKGFTLIELLVVVAIIGILAAVGVTAFSGFQESAKVKSMQSIHSGVVKVIASELKKCTLGQSTFMTGTNSAGTSISQNCDSNSNTLATRAVAGIAIFKDKNPWSQSEAAVKSGTAYEKGRVNIGRSGANVQIKTCWNDTCSGDNIRQTTVLAE